MLISIKVLSHIHRQTIPRPPYYTTNLGNSRHCQGLILPNHEKILHTNQAPRRRDTQRSNLYPAIPAKYGRIAPRMRWHVAGQYGSQENAGQNHPPDWILAENSEAEEVENCYAISLNHVLQRQAYKWFYDHGPTNPQ